MHFSHRLEDDEEYEIVECTKLDNNILLYKKKIDENAHPIIKLKENQNAILFKKGQVLDLIKEAGVYSIKNEPNSYFPEDLIDYQIKNNESQLCVIFFNKNVITNNKFYIQKKHKNNFYGEGSFDFQIEKPLKLFNKVIEVRNYYSKEELLEQIRERISKIAISVLKEQQNQAIINQEICLKANIFKNYGIHIVATNIENIQFRGKS